MKICIYLTMEKKMLLAPRGDGLRDSGCPGPYLANPSIEKIKFLADL